MFFEHCEHVFLTPWIGRSKIVHMYVYLIVVQKCIGL